MLVKTEIHDCRDGQQVRTHINEQGGTKTVFTRLYTGRSLFFGYIWLFFTPNVTDWLAVLAM